MYSFFLLRVSHKGEFYRKVFNEAATLDLTDQVLKQIYNSPSPAMKG